MKAYYSQFVDYHAKTLKEENRSFWWVSFLYFLFDDIVFMVEFFPDSTWNMSFVREDMI